MIKRNKIPTLLGIIMLLAGVFAGVFFLGTKQIFKIGADSSVIPKDIRTTNLSDISATITWTTDKETVGFVNWGESRSSLGQVEKESQTDTKYYTHSITLSGLKPDSSYFYKINSGGVSFDNNGLPWEFTTGSALAVNKTGSVISGSVITASGTPEKRALVYVDIGGYLLSTTTSDTGTFVFQLESVRTPDLQNYADINEKSTLLQISVVAGSGQIASVQIFPQSAKPIPPIVLGQVQDYRNLQPSSDGQIPSANLNLPENQAKQSKFNITFPTGSPSPTSVILESLSEGEIITSTKPAFFGRGPGGETITITVQSDPITQTVQIAGNGTWTWTPPSELASGAHLVTISWVDTNGVTRTLTRNFIVQAGEVPAFEATPSQTLAPTISPTSTPRATATPRATPTSTSSAIPVPITGSSTSTLLLTFMGIAVTLFGFIIWKNAESI